MMRNLMIAEMREVIGDPNHTSRYGGYFFRPKEEITRRERKFKARAVADKRIDLDTLEALPDAELLNAYRTFVRRMFTFM